MCTVYSLRNKRLIVAAIVVCELVVCSFQWIYLPFRLSAPLDLNKRIILTLMKSSNTFIAIA